ncbi:CLUMA_CG015918, isoform A [Clunio marinus]|uniref:CLUMA_CG015918, isoform A n=1 Tax=Clunio marinus TaxID=568069 RepID=A0A1J1ITC3_9DIPT|nr:CLUMA_CG015918, isoform A [Clunio marinus]
MTVMESPFALMPMRCHLRSFVLASKLIRLSSTNSPFIS